MITRTAGVEAVEVGHPRDGMALMVISGGTTGDMDDFGHAVTIAVMLPRHLAPLMLDLCRTTRARSRRNHPSSRVLRG